MRYFLFICLLILVACPRVRAQETKRALEVSDLESWNQIEDEQISADGNYVVYTLSPDKGDPVTVVYDVRTRGEQRYPNLHSVKLTYDGRYVVALEKPGRDTVKAYTLADKKKELKAKNSLFVLALGQSSPTRFTEVYGMKMGEEWSGHVAYTTKSNISDSLRGDLDKEAKLLMVRSLDLKDSFYIEGITDFTVAETAPVVLAQRAEKDSTWSAGMAYLDTRELKWKIIGRGDNTYAKPSLSRDGAQAAFLSHPASIEDKQSPFDLHYFRAGMDSARMESETPGFVMRGMRITDDRQPVFSYDGDHLYYGTTARRPEKDTTLTDEEIADVEVWTTNDPLLYTQQNVRLKDEQKRSYLAVFNPSDRSSYQLGSPDLPYEYFPRDRRGDYVALYDDRPYAKEKTWAGFPGKRDLYIADPSNGRVSLVAENEELPVRWTEGGDYLIWYSPATRRWESFDPRREDRQLMADTTVGTFYDEEDDHPADPGSYGYGGTLDDGRILLYDRYDIWVVDPGKEKALEKLTDGRDEKLRYRVIDATPYNDLLSLEDGISVSIFNTSDKSGGFGMLGEDGVRVLMAGAHRFSNLRKARSTGQYLFSKEDFRTFPDLRLTSDLSKEGIKISNANPQQGDFSWGTAEPYTWIDHEGRSLEGTLIKPEGFDPTKQYPMLVNFYERSSDRLYQHRTPYPHRSTINYSYYASRGYVIFNPDVIYRIGYPGESAYDCVMSGVSSLLAEGFVDKERVALQGHSWGGYQGAYIATKTDLFACMELGAPVVNMFSAYGGIRWGSGLSRQFQYEKTQSRIGGSPWEYPMRYWENSPLFTTDKINTPILILHNDGDGAVPWYQGIEWFTALRRLGKDAWLLNYRGEPHWPLKRANRADFNRRMSQFFDHYLMDAPMPVWMKQGVSPMERGINQGLEVESRE